jgi:ElaB/YqjD/DUF883 family membrane-anchored ribosome-binding protein
MPQDTAARADAAVDDAVRRARNMKNGAGNVAENFQTAVDRSVSEQPLTTLVMAIAVGFILGAIWKA